MRRDCCSGSRACQQGRSSAHHPHVHPMLCPNPICNTFAHIMNPPPTQQQRPGHSQPRSAGRRRGSQRHPGASRNLSSPSDPLLLSRLPAAVLQGRRRAPAACLRRGLEGRDGGRQNPVMRLPTCSHSFCRPFIVERSLETRGNVGGERERWGRVEGWIWLRRRRGVSVEGAHGLVEDDGRTRVRWRGEKN